MTPTDPFIAPVDNATMIISSFLPLREYRGKLAQAGTIKPLMGPRLFPAFSIEKAAIMHLRAVVRTISIA